MQIPKPDKLKINLKLVEVEWDLSSPEKKALRKFTNEVITRRALDINHGHAQEDPTYFISSITEFRSSLRSLLNELPPNSKDARIILLTATEWAGELLDSWHYGINEVIPNRWEREHISPHKMKEVMELVWPVVEVVRKLINELAEKVEAQL